MGSSDVKVLCGGGDTWAARTWSLKNIPCPSVPIYNPGDNYPMHPKVGSNLS